jgi:hypothetical protein
MQKATNSSFPTRRSQAAVFAVTPAHSKGDESSNFTRTVSPSLKLSIFPTARHS